MKNNKNNIYHFYRLECIIPILTKINAKFACLDFNETDGF
ncbi:hypothetical protein SAMN05421825_1571 [Epilithonimonas hungarica]|uniref:Uncharacterized protein n=1 Tax=Epilithonimonas hungarica TaxID=454006 RepID=A0A1G7LR11_9FLAO|nr:hypothetical protein SAMN05421825_1571 [Epilithonimonas hungarica]